jgi:hypothetical protein
MKTPQAKTGFYVSEYDNSAGNAALSRCDIPGTSLSVCISEEAAFRVAEHYRERSVRSSLLSRHAHSGTSVTGILLGCYEGEERRIVSIEQLHPVAWRPSTDSERRPLTPEQIIAPLVHDKTKPPPIGFYALSDRFDSELLNRDLSLFSRYFTNPNSVFVLFGRSADETVAQIFARGNAETPVHSVNLTLHIDEVATRRQRFSSAHHPDEPSGSPAFLPASPPFAGRAPDSPANSPNSRIWVVVVLLLVLLLIGSAWYGMGIRLPIASAPQPDRIGLRIERTGRDVLITWDSTSGFLRGATLALFRIRDGLGTKDIGVFPEELKQGRLLYIPASNELEVHMKVFTRDNRTVEESVRIIDGSVPDRLETAERQLPVKGMIAGFEKLFSAERSANPPQTSLQSAAESPAVKSLKPFVPPVSKMSVPDHAEEVATSLTPPQFSPQPSQGSMKLPLTQQQATPVQPPPPPSSPRAEQLSPMSTPSPSSATDVAAIVRPVDVAVSPPKPRRQVPVILPEYLRRLISKDTTVDIHCTVAADGRVTNVMAPRPKPWLEGHLSELAAATARKWLFTPARVNGQPVSSDYVITFSFRRSNH